MIARAALIAAPVAAALAGVAALAQSQAPPAGPSPQAATSTASRTPEGAWASFNERTEVLTRRTDHARQCG